MLQRRRDLALFKPSLGALLAVYGAVVAPDAVMNRTFVEFAVLNNYSAICRAWLTTLSPEPKPNTNRDSRSHKTSLTKDIESPMKRSELSKLTFEMYCSQQY